MSKFYSKFGIGDHVVMKNVEFGSEANYLEGDRHCNIEFLSEMNKLKGAVVTVSETHYKFTSLIHIKECNQGYWYHEDWFESECKPFKFEIEEEMFLV